MLKVRGEKGMPNFDASKMANNNIAALCAYQGRSDTFRWCDSARQLEESK